MRTLILLVFATLWAAWIGSNVTPFVKAQTDAVSAYMAGRIQGTR